MSNIEITDNKKANANKIVNCFAGAPTELKRQLKAVGLRYVKVEKGASVRYVVRSLDRQDAFRAVIKL